MTTRIPTNIQNGIAGYVSGAVDAGAGPGYLEIRTGVQPASANDAASGTLLATVVMGDPAYGAPAGGVAAAADPAPVDATGAGDAGWFREYDSDGATVRDGNVTATGGGGELELSSISLTPGIEVDITALSIAAGSGE